MKNDDILECSIFKPNDVICQGTIIKFCNENQQEYKYGIIVTGDCDIAQEKHGIYLSYCCIMSLEYYIKKFYIQKKCKNKLSKIIGQIKEKVFEILNRKLDDRAMEHVFSLSRNELDELLKNNGVVEKIIDIQNYMHEGDFSLEEYKKICSPKNKDFEKDIRNFPGDKFFIGNIPDPERNTEGFVVDFRRIKEIKRDEITINYFGNDAKCFAIANLNSPYKQKMSQALGAMFSDLGLPESYENNRNSIISKISGEFIK